MRNIKSIMITGMVLVTMGISSCMDDFDTPVTGNAYGNNSISEERTISIANLKNKYASTISGNQVGEVDVTTRIVGVVVGDDESGNIYKQLVLSDESGSIIVGINNTGLYTGCPVGQKVVIDLKGLYVGGYGKQAQIGTLYNGKIGRMDYSIWQEHVRILNRPQTNYVELNPIVMTGAQLSAYNKDEAPLLVTFKNITIKEADGTSTYAPEAMKDGGNGVNRTLVLDDNSTLTLRTSAYANFANKVMPSGKVTVTGILSRYNSSWQIVARTSSDIQRNN